MECSSDNDEDEIFVVKNDCSGLKMMVVMLLLWITKTMMMMRRRRSRRTEGANEVA